MIKDIFTDSVTSARDVNLAKFPNNSSDIVSLLQFTAGYRFSIRNDENELDFEPRCF